MLRRYEILKFRNGIFPVHFGNQMIASDPVAKLDIAAYPFRDRKISIVAIREPS